MTTITYKINFDAVGSVLNLRHEIVSITQIANRGRCKVYTDGTDNLVIDPHGFVTHEDNNRDGAVSCIINDWYNKGYIELI